jgi:hypothetical protein
MRHWICVENTQRREQRRIAETFPIKSDHGWRMRRPTELGPSKSSEMDPFVMVCGSRKNENRVEELPSGGIVRACG